MRIVSSNGTMKLMNQMSLIKVISVRIDIFKLRKKKNWQENHRDQSGQLKSRIALITIAEKN